MKRLLATMLMAWTCVGFSSSTDLATFMSNFLTDWQSDHAKVVITDAGGQPLYELIYKGQAKYQLCQPGLPLCPMPAMMTLHCD